MIRYFSIAMVACALALSSCDDSEDFFLSMNENPTLTVLSHGSALEQFNDSIKVGFPLSFDYSIEDEENVGLFVIEGNSNVNVEILDNRFLVHGVSSGSYNIKVGCTDSFGGTVEFPLNVKVFVNLKPVCNMAIYTFTGREIELNLADSFDRDSRFGGEITLYEYDFNGYGFTSGSDKVRHVFASEGQKRVRARVQDNNNEWSDWIEAYVSIN